MKRNIRIAALWAIVAVAAVSCRKEELTIDTPAPAPEAWQYFSYSFNVADQDTKAILENDGVFWEENDAVGMYLAGNHTEANINIETSPKTIFLNSTSQIPNGSTAYAYYPYDQRNNNISSTIIRIPREQVGGAESAMPMAGIPFTVMSGDTNGEVYFLNLGAIIDFKVFSSSHSDETVKYIIFRDNAATISGDAILDLSSLDPDDETTMALDNWGTDHYSYVTVRHEVPVASSKDAAASVHMVLAPGQYASGNIIIGTDKATYTFSYTNKELGRNELKHYNMNLDSANCTREATKSLPYSETFASGQGAFTTDGVQVASTNVWRYSSGAMKASAYKSKAYASESWLISPWVDLTEVESAAFSFEHSYYYETDPRERLTIWVMTDEANASWQRLPDPKYPDGSSLDTYAASGSILLDTYVGHNVRIGFKYVSTSTSSQCATWQIKNFKVEEIVPTPVYSLYSGELTEGDYVIYSNGYAMKAEVYNKRLGYLAVTPSNDEIVAPDASIVWHIAPSGNYWTIYNANGYAASNGNKNEAQLLADGADDRSLWTASGTSPFAFVNKYNSSSSVNANLRFNSGTNGDTFYAYFACYAANTGSGLTLYKLGGAGGSGSGSGGSGTSVSGLQYLGCIEVPALALVNENACTASGAETFGDTKWFAYNTTTSTRRVATHTYSYNSKTYRNYTVMVDQNKRCPLWSAYPMHKGAYPSNKLGRVGSFSPSTSYDPAFARSWQSSGSTSDYDNGAGYARGHLCASADRQAVEEANEQTFYYTNQAPQIQNSFNSGVWSSLEGFVQDNAPSSSKDTLYVVSGVLFEDGNSGSSNDGGTVGRPSHFYKLLMLCTYTGSTITAARGVAYIYTNEAHTGVNFNASQFRTTIDAIETRAGFDFFPGVPDGLQTAAEQMTASLW